MLVKTSELSGVQLDWAVAQAEGLQVTRLKPLLGEDLRLLNKESDWWNPSESWAQGGPIIERAKLGVWWATHYVDDDEAEEIHEFLRNHIDVSTTVTYDDGELV